MVGIGNYVHGGEIVDMQMYLEIIQDVIQKQNYGMEIAILPYLMINVYCYYCLQI